MLDVSHEEPLALILTGMLLHLWSPRCFSFFRKRRCLYIHKQRVAGSGGVLQRCETELEAGASPNGPCKARGLRRELEVQGFGKV